jgi:autoinducer 2-degrading protein
MIIRIVKLTLLPSKRDEFITLFAEVSDTIREFPGCHDVELLYDITDNNILFTWSRWQSASDLEKYRQSVLFNGTWSKAKQLFAAKAEAWSLDEINSRTMT